MGLHYHTSEEGAVATQTAIAQVGGTAYLLPGDLSREDQATQVIADLIRRTRQLDILVNNAGSPVEMRRIEACPTELWRRVLDVNLTSAFLVTRGAIPHLRAMGRGSIINNLSLSVQTGGAGGAGAYAAAKGGLHVLTRTLARELAPQVRVNALMPGVIETRHHEVYSTPQKMADYREQTPLGRNGQADEVAAAALFLASDAASFITGAVIDVNGGRFLR